MSLFQQLTGQHQSVSFIFWDRPERVLLWFYKLKRTRLRNQLLRSFACGQCAVRYVLLTPILTKDKNAQTLPVTFYQRNHAAEVAFSLGKAAESFHLQCSCFGHFTRQIGERIIKHFEKFKSSLCTETRRTFLFLCLVCACARLWYVNNSNTIWKEQTNKL